MAKKKQNKITCILKKFKKERHIVDEIGRIQDELRMSHCLVNHIPTMQFSIGISRNTQSKSYMLSLTEYEWESQNDALCDILKHALFQLHKQLVKL